LQMLESATRAGAPPEVLSSLRKREDRIVGIPNAPCCAFRRPWQDWQSDSHRQHVETTLGFGFATEPIDKSSLHFMLAFDAVHLNAAFSGEHGIPAANRAQRSGRVSANDIRAEVDRLSALQSPVHQELLLLAPHRDGVVFLPDNETLEVQEIKTYAKSRGVFVRILGCNSSQSDTLGVAQAFDAQPLIKSLASVLSNRRDMTRVDLLNALHKDTGLEFHIDALGYEREQQAVRVSARRQGTNVVQQTDAGGFEFDLGIGAATGTALADLTGSSISAAPAESATEAATSAIGLEAANLEAGVDASTHAAQLDSATPSDLRSSMAVFLLCTFGLGALFVVPGVRSRAALPFRSLLRTQSASRRV
jgi:hypothetical protein